MLRKKDFFHIIVTLMAFCTLSVASGKTFQHIQQADYDRLEFKYPKEQLLIEQMPGKIVLKTLNALVFKEIKQSLEDLGDDFYKAQKFFEKPLFMQDQNQTYSIEFKLKSEKYEVFSFYRESEKMMVLDFWGEANTPPSSFDKKEQKKIAKDLKKESEGKKSEKVNTPIAPIRKLSSVNLEKIQIAEKNVPGFRDYRYGASFIWDYAPVLPPLNALINIEFKTAEDFYPLNFQEIEDKKKNEHLKLIFKLYKEEKWGLMYKSIKLFDQKYSSHIYYDDFDFMKANALVRGNLSKREVGPIKMAMSLYDNIALRTQNYLLKSGILKYLISYYQKMNDNVKTLEYAKRLYSETKVNLDLEDAAIAASFMMQSLALLGHDEGIIELTKDSLFYKLVARDKVLTYTTYVLLGRQKNTIVIENIEKFLKDFSIEKKIDAEIYFNYAEALFREAKYEKALFYFDKIIKDYSFHPASHKAFNRLGLIYEILAKDPVQNIFLYKQAINRIQDPYLQLESRIRLVGLNYVRRLERKKEDLESIFFLDNIPDLKAHPQLQKLLWLVRLRSMIVDKNFSEAYGYLSAINLASLSPLEVRVFDGDGAEVVAGLIMDKYKSGDFAEAIKIFDKNKTKYLEKVAKDPYLHYLIAKSYLILGLYDLSEEAMSDVKSLEAYKKRTYPVWIERKEHGQVLFDDLSIARNIKLKNFEQAKEGLLKLREQYQNDLKVEPPQIYALYMAQIWHSEKKYEEAISEIEKYLSKSSELLENTKEVASSLEIYTDSLIQLKNWDKYFEVLAALLQDVEAKSNRPEIGLILERALFVGMEKSIELSKHTKNFPALYDVFSKIFPENKRYKDRIEFFSAKYSLIMGDQKKAQATLGKIIDNKEYSDYVKSLARSELSLLEIKNKVL
jgi:tetratricopeptide (TPR) repeat protein